ncbi:heterokaryon incompatibility protein-domain-containing protein [Lasiosphaeria ovina]|uniref:Heterokaryon incompatibility protein-domain-containing protein n=1 Tax=Lasiosphaeria ovina TaxID=92902 RepID=A0AAE0KML2_9PEZI|nr:heterokaryon incompatibility protein-domain-containing protein [Lasiosphaeria ovina]
MTHITYCQEQHSQACLSDHQNAPTGLKLIECATRKVVAAPAAARYVALSYVWGSAPNPLSHSSEPEVRGETLGSLPRVIEDSIDVTVQLGLQHLWVDRYCIDQGDSEEKLQQIHQMDLVYANAELTLVAAAGTGPQFGLPGCNGTPRHSQSMAQVRGRLLVSTFPDPSFLLSQSTWATRGWTYQEGILSKRRLVFTEKQVLFDCNGTNLSEKRAWLCRLN